MPVKSMHLYKKIMSYVLPFWKMVLLAVLLTMAYVLFNNISVWISVDFVKELFDPHQETVLSRLPAQVMPGASGEADGEAQEKGPERPAKKQSRNLYHDINTAIKKVIIQEDKYDTLKIVCLVIFLSFLLKNITYYYRRVVINLIELRLIVNIRNRLHAVIMRLPLGYFDRHHTGNLTSIVFNDVKSIRQVLHESFGNMLLTPIQITVNLGILILISWRLSLITFTIIPISGFLIIQIGRSIRRKSRRVLRRVSDVLSLFQEAVSAIPVVKAFTAENLEINQFESANWRYYRAQVRRNQLTFATSPLNETLGVLILIVLLWVGGRMVYAERGLEAEDFIRYLVFLFTTFQPLREFSKLNNTLQKGLAAAERIFNVIDEEQEVYDKPEACQLKQFQKAIELDHVTFRYTPEDPQVLKNINLSIRKGQTVAFVGHSGAGKSTLVNLIPRFYDVESGRILLDGVDIRDYRLVDLRKQIGIVSQDTMLFNDTVRANIAYGMEDVSDERIKEAARAANAWEFIKDLDHGLDNIIGERGVTLSGGQKQRLSIARAILKNPPILVLDEATSALDTQSERLVQEAIETLMKNRTVLVIAHRLSTVIHADQIVVMKHGEISGVGHHRHLLKTCPLYKVLYEMQFRDET